MRITTSLTPLSLLIASILSPTVFADSFGVKAEPVENTESYAMAFEQAEPEQESKLDPKQEQEIERIGVVRRRTSVMSEITESADKLVVMPGAGGDPLQAAFALPGIVAAGGSSSSPAVRGSSPDDNLFEVDFMPAGYIFHDFGQSIFNKHLIQDFQLLSAGYGTSYNNATGAVFDVNLRTPKQQELKTIVDFSLFNFGVFMEGEVTENSAFYFSARKSMLPVFFGAGDTLDDEETITVNEPFDDNDYQGKWVWDMTSNDVLSVSVTGAEDKAGINLTERSDISLRSPEFAGDADFNKKFTSQSVIWDHYGKDLQFKLGVGSLNNSQVLSIGKNAESPNGIYVDESKEQLTYKSRLSYRLNDSHKLLADAAYYDQTTEYEYDIFLQICTEIDPNCGDNGDRVSDEISIDTSSHFIGLSDVFTVNDFWQLELGVQWQHYNYTDEDFVQPKVAVNYFISDNSIIKAKYGLYSRQQNTDEIVPKVGNPNLLSQTAEHFTLGFEQDLDNDWIWSIEGYYKEMNDLPLALDDSQADADLLYSNDVSGTAYGLDLLINKNITDNWYGWLSVSYSKSERTNLRTNTDINYYADTPVVINMVFNYKINDDWTAGFNFTGRSGQPYTPIIGVKENPDYDDRYQPIYGEAFTERFDLAHRLDVRVERKTTVWGFDAMWVFEIMNAYGQENTASIDLDYQEVNSTDDLIIVENTDDFVIRPSVGFSITF
ncbi:TonB-dependent receptor [Psychrosphaera saromensis]|uniref:TonB-dependent receptor n=1 Tax=Psychrosphaera saromensis TaxID=716813 RepID=A0A2S7UWD1_9GAMM|nr:TonB-dependent receptor [Psychrosphaera saromensis]PQJ54294.1 TonB-dependent receptor [Psychrosphaera saromensis]GHB74490.1 TonB-dependent receptor [Psychrosphaera saromensis]GLQ12604.1 TonB-dependent receptor [Psychrosphaera saromensis]